MPIPSLRRTLLLLLRFISEVSFSSLLRRSIPLGTSVRENHCKSERASLHRLQKDVQLRYNARACTCSRPATRTTTYLPEGAAHRDSFSSQAARGSFHQRTASSLSSVDRATHYLLPACNSRRSCSKQSRAGGRKCPPTTTTHHPQTAGETPCMHENGSPAPRPLGTGSSDLETSALHRSTRYASSLASRTLPLVLETQVKS